VVQELGRHFGRRADRKPIETVDRRGKFLLLLAEIGRKFDIKAAIFEDGDRRRRQRIRN
jgi:hypothetical protein